ncbi:LisH domain-containing protein [Aphelenchoides fujianensis]|nr:LisH domain-containing protein [Aphelenchoides fujianensis]
MHVGGNPHLAPNTTRSVADRIKGITLSEHLAAAYDNNLPLDGPVLNEETNRENNQTRASTSQFGTAEQCRARPKPTAAANLVANKRNMVAPSITLDERQRNTVRIIGQYLTSLGLKNTAEQLVEETGCRIENPLAVRLRNHIRQRSWARAIEVLDRMRDVLGPENYNRTRVLLVEERIKEKFAAKDTIGVLKLLRNEYPTGEEFRERREFLTTRLFRDAGDTAALFEKRDTEKVVDETLKYLYKLMPSTVLLAPDRLERLINHAWNYQLERCDLHVNEADTKTQGSEFVLKDHSCSTEDFPSHCAQVLRDHKTEVWCVKFSPCGKMLATGAKDSKIIVWKVEDEKPLRLSKYRRLRLPQNVAGVAVLSWSSDSRLLAVATSERTQRGVFIFNISAGDQLSEIRSTQNENFNAVAFFADNSHRFACADHNGNFQYHDVDNPTKDGHTVIAADNLNRIRSYDFDTQEEITLIHENSHITYFSVDPTEEFCLVTTKNEGLRLWSLTTRTLVPHVLRLGAQRFRDHVDVRRSGRRLHRLRIGRFVFEPSFHDQVIIWNRRSDKPVHRIQGHTGSVNSVSWNPVQHRMLASASDDGTVRIWVPAGDVSTS